jgi:hypothetical protein
MQHFGSGPNYPVKSKRSCSKQLYRLILLFGTVWQFFFTIVTHELPTRLSQHSRCSYAALFRSAKDALAKLAELTDMGHAEVVVRDSLGKVIDPSILETEADAG